MTIALHNYHDTTQGFPAARNWLNVAAVSSSIYTQMENEQWNATFFLLPYAEQTAVYDSVVSDVRSSATFMYPWNFYDSGVVERIGAFCCPSDGDAKLPPPSTAYKSGRTSIITCRGDAISRTEFWGDPAGYGDPNYINGVNRGVFGIFTFKSMASIADGTSNTIAFSETVTSESLADKRVKGGVLASFTPSGYGASNPSACFSARNGSELSNSSGGSFTAAYRGTRILDGRMAMDGFATVLPPNSPSCTLATTASGTSTFTANSNHPGGVNVGLVDGSCRFVSETIDAGRLSDPQDLTGASPYGVWGAYGSVNGGESKSL